MTSCLQIFLALPALASVEASPTARLEPARTSASATAMFFIGDFLSLPEDFPRNPYCVGINSCMAWSQQDVEKVLEPLQGVCSSFACAVPDRIEIGEEGGFEPTVRFPYNGFRV